MKSFPTISFFVNFIFWCSVCFAQNSDSLYIPQEKVLAKCIVITVDPVTLSSIDSCIQIYITFLLQEGYHVVLHRTTEETPMELREYLYSQYKVMEPILTGAVIIGSFPLPFSMVEHPDRGRVPYLSMEFFQDLDGGYTWTDVEGVDFAFDNHTGSVESEIWTSVIPLIGASGSDSAMQKIVAYFQKNFAFRKKMKMEVRRGHAEPIIGYKNMDVWQQQIDVFIKEQSYALRGGNLSITRDNSRSDDERYPDARYTYETELFTDRFDFISVGGHGSYYYFTHTEPSISINMQWADTNAILPLYLIDGSCNTGEFHSHDVGCLATSFLFNPQNNVVIYTAATNYSYGGYKNAEGTWRNVFIKKLSEGLSFGEALLYNFRQSPVDLMDRERDAYTAPRILFGDGTLKLQEFMDYEGNDPPYVFTQKKVAFIKDDPLTVSLDDLDIIDNDNGVEKLSIRLFDGDHYSIVENRAVPEDGYYGFINIPVCVNDGIEDGQHFNLIAFSDSSDSVIVCEKGEAGQIIDNIYSDIKNGMNDGLSGRIYFFPDTTDTLTAETYNEITINITARGTEIGEVVFRKKIIEKKDGYSSVKNSAAVAQISDFHMTANNGTLQFYYGTKQKRQSPITVYLYNVRGEVVRRAENRCGVGSVNISDLSQGSYIVKVHSLHGTTIVKKLLLHY